MLTVGPRPCHSLGQRLLLPSKKTVRFANAPIGYGEVASNFILELQTPLSWVVPKEPTENPPKHYLVDTLARVYESNLPLYKLLITAFEARFPKVNMVPSELKEQCPTLNDYVEFYSQHTANVGLTSQLFSPRQRLKNNRSFLLRQKDPGYQAVVNAIHLLLPYVPDDSPQDLF